MGRPLIIGALVWLSGVGVASAAPASGPERPASAVAPAPRERPRTAAPADAPREGAKPDAISPGVEPPLPSPRARPQRAAAVATPRPAPRRGKRRRRARAEIADPVAAGLGTRDRRGRLAPKQPLSLDTDPPHLLPMAMSRAVFLWPASPRLRTAAWVAVHYFVEPPQTYRRYDPEFVYKKSDQYLVATVGGAFTFRSMELSLAVPFVGLFGADFYEKGVVDRQVRKIDRADLRLGFKYGFRIRRGKDLWLITPYVAVTAPTQQREMYEISLAGYRVAHFTAPPRAVSVLPGLALGWRQRYWSAVMSFGGLVTVPVDRDPVVEEGEPGRSLEVSFLAAYQFGFTPFRDLSVTLALQHLRELTVPVKEQRDLFLLAPAIRLQPYLGLYGHIGVMAPIGRATRKRQPVMIHLQAGWEFK